MRVGSNLHPYIDPTDFTELVEEERRRSGRDVERANGAARAEPRTDSTTACTDLTLGEDAPLEDVVRAHVRGVWERHGRNGSEAARILGITRNTLRAKLGPDRG